MNIPDYIKQVQKKEIDIVEQTYKVLDQCAKINKEYHYLNTISDELAIKQARALQKKPTGKLSGVYISVKDSICVQDVESTAGSHILRGYKPLFSATGVQRAIDEGAIIIGKTSQDEFGFGGFSTNVGIGYQIPLNPFDVKRTTGGSSGGAAGLAQKADFPHIAIGESTGGSIVNPASFCGVYGLTPTYGLVSRYGLIDYGNSLDKIGPLAKDPGACAQLLQIMAGHDARDSTSSTHKADDYASYLTKPVKDMTIGVVKEALGEGVDAAVKKHIHNAINTLEKAGCTLKEITLPIGMQYGIPVYYLLATSEASTNLAKYCGMRYGNEEPLHGNFTEYFTDVRSRNFGKEAKRRILLGTFARMAGYRDAYYIKALKVRTKIIEEYKRAFNNVDTILTPTVPILPPTLTDISTLTLLQNYMIDILTVSPNLAGLPHMNIPIAMEKGLPVGMLLTSDHFNEGKLLQLSKELLS